MVRDQLGRRGRGEHAVQTGLWGLGGPRFGARERRMSPRQAVPQSESPLVSRERRQL